MSHPQDDETYEPGTVVRLLRTGEFALINRVVFAKDYNQFLHYEGPIEGRSPRNYALYHGQLALECLPFEIIPAF